MAAQDWVTAYESYSATQTTAPLSAGDLDAIAQAAWWIGLLEQAIETHEEAFRGYEAAGETGNAVLCALYLSYYCFNKGEFAVGAGWQARASRLAQKIPDSAATGYLGIVECDFALRSGDLEACLAKAKRVLELGEDHKDPTLLAYGLHWQGHCLIRQGQLDQGWALLDDAMLEVSMRNMHPIWAGFLHGSTIAVCEELGDPHRRGVLRQGHRMGYDPQPGLALLRLAQGKPEAAAVQIQQALDEAPDPLARARPLPPGRDLAVPGGPPDRRGRG
jgi:tetratricopeptide (TPR) repeat protein